LWKGLDEIQTFFIYCAKKNREKRPENFFGSIFGSAPIINRMNSQSNNLTMESLILAQDER
jgi:hypothetical protein